MDLRSYYREFRYRQKQNGLIPTIQTGIKFVVNNPMSVLRGTDYQTHKRTDIEYRWELIQDCIDPDDYNALDIGCAEGVLTSRLADAGLFTIGVDKSIPRLSSAQRINQSNENVGFMRHELSPDTVHRLPQFDIVLLLTVYHHWCRDYGYGWNNAEEMFYSIINKSGKLVFECPNEPIDKPGFNTDRPVRDQYEAYFDDVLCDVSVDYLGCVDYKGGDRDDLMFLIS